MAVLTLDLCDGATGNWIQSANVTESKDITDYKEGTASRKFVIAADFTTGIIAYKNTSTINATSYVGVSFYIKSDIAIAANTLRLDLCSDDAGVTPLDSFTISQALVAGEWTFLHYDSGSALSNVIESLALYALLDPGIATINLDKIEACNIFYIDYLLGNNANAGTSWALAWQDLTNGATAARIAPGDCIHYAKSSDPVSLGNATWTDKSATVTLATPQTANIETCDGATGDWVAPDPVNVTESKELTYYKEGTGSRKFVIAAGFVPAVVAVAYKNISILDLHTYQKCSFWIRCDITGGVAANTFRLDLCSDDAGVTPVNSFTIPIRLETARWYCLTYDPNAGAGNLGSAIESVALYALLDPGAATVYLDNIIACTTNGLNLQSLLGKNTVADPTWWSLKSINGTTVILAGSQNQGTTVNAYSDDNGAGGNEIVETYSRETIKTIPAIATTTAVQSITDSGTLGAFITFSGGWNPATNVRDGKTFLDGLNEWGYGIYGSSRNYIKLENLNCIRYQYNIVLNICHYSEINTISISSVYSLQITGNYGIINIVATCNSFGIYAQGYYCIFTRAILKGNSYGFDARSCFDNILYSPIMGTNSTSDVYLDRDILSQVLIYNGKFLSITDFTVHANAYLGGSIRTINYDGIDNNHKSLFLYLPVAANYYTVLFDTTIFETTPSTRVTPGHATLKAELIIATCAVADTETATCTVKVRESVVGDGTDYNGARIELVLKRHDGLGIMNDMILDTATVASEGTFEELSGTSPAVTDNGVLEFVIRCSGTTGWVNIETIIVS